ncbi:hypothetical protein RIF29_18399 [Crotalaria pallida]|uniref:Uncharacterized protein n=1 Tax=Crotalaria pallida TaxID=3830 RepID=A0AAN9FSL2_CROPI
MVIQNSVLDPRDQRTSSMEDSTAMTVEFLRARLLSERSVSRSSRQRADELAKKVMELEDQLRVVTLQRKMAEKATVDVLAILESQGISDVSEEFDFGSDLETPCDSGVSNDSASAKCGETSNVDSSSPAPGRSLSWKGRLDSSRSLEKYKTSNVRRRSSFSSISSSPKHRLGKSCRRLKHRETRSVVEDSRGEPVNLDCEGNKAVPFPEGFSNGSNDGPNILRRECQIQEQDESVLKLANKNHGVGGERESNMETALEHQARLIDQYEAMEKAQREWEEKFRENNSSTPESCDLGNHSDVTEERDESKSRSPWSARVAASSSQDDESKPFDNMPKLLYDTGDNNQQGKTVGTSGVHGQENSPSLLKGNQEEGHKNCLAQPPHQHHDSPCRLDSPDLKPTNSFPTDVYGALPLKVGVSNKNSLYELVSHEQTHEINGVLESLKQAKLSLQRKISKLPLVEGGYTGKAIQTSPLVSKSEERFGIPVGFSGLFRLPTDLSDEATARFSFRDSTSGFSSNGTGISRISDDHFGSRPYFGTMLTSSSDDRSLATGYLGTGSRFDTNRAPSYFTDESSARFSFPDSTSGFSPNVYPGRGIPRISSGLSGANPYSGTMSSSSADNQYLSTRNVETGTRFDTERAPSAPFFERGLVSSGQYLNPPTFPISSYYQNAAPPVSFDEGLSRPHSSSTFGVPPAYHFPFHGDHTK